jgi:hypothetical protein
MARGVAAACAAVEQHAVGRVQRGAEALVFHLSELRGLALASFDGPSGVGAGAGSGLLGCYAALGLDAGAVGGVLAAAEATVLKAEEVLLVVQGAAADYAALFAWMGLTHE